MKVGAVLVPADFDKDGLKGVSEEEFERMIMEDNLVFAVHIDDVVEMHIFHPVECNFEGGDTGLWPFAAREGEYIRVDTAFDNGKQSYMLVKKVTVAAT